MKVYDCYRPQMAVNEFLKWSSKRLDKKMKAEFYPRFNKKDVFKLGFVAALSGHTRGSAVDLTIVPLPVPKQPVYKHNDPLKSCLAPVDSRFPDNSIDMGTGFDCMDARAHIHDRSVSTRAYRNRMWLRQIMKKNGFAPYEKEWWHFTLRGEPYPHRYFNFPIQ